MALKIIAISGKQDFYRIGTDFASSFWYSNERVLDVPVMRGDVVEMKWERSEQGVNIITSIKVLEKAPEQPKDPSYPTPSKEWRSKSPQESESIRKQAVGKMVAESLKAFTPFQNAEVMVEFIDKLFLKYDELTK